MITEWLAKRRLLLRRRVWNGYVPGSRLTMFDGLTFTCGRFQVVMVRMVAIATLLGGFGPVGCALHGHKLDFSPLERGDRIEVRTRAGALVRTITDRSQIQAAVDFIERYPSGWKDPLGGPRVPRLMLLFFRGDTGISGFGVGRGYIVSDPSTLGFWSRDIASDEIDGLVRALGLSEIFAKQ